jgi:hypothetical protein
MTGLDGVPWAQLRTLRRSGQEVAALLATAADPAVYAPQAMAALREVQQSVVDDGMISEAGALLPRFLAQIAQRPEESVRDGSLDVLELVATAMPGSHSEVGDPEQFPYLRRRELVACLPALRAVQGRFARQLAELIEDEIVPGGVVPQQWRAQARPFLHHRADRLFLVPMGDRVVLVATTNNMSSGIGCWDAQTGEQLGPLLDGVAKHAYRDGSDVVIAGIDGWAGRARRWAVPSGRKPAPLRLPRRLLALRRRVMDKVTATTYYRDGEYEIVAAGDESGTVRCFDAASGEPVGGATRLHGRVTALWSYQQAGRAHLAAGDEFGYVWRWLPGPHPRPQQVHGKHHQYVRHGAAYREGERAILVTGATDQAVYRWDAETGASLGDPWVMNDVIGGICSFLDGDRTILAIGGFCQIQRFDTVAGQRYGDLIQGHQEPISDTGYAEVAGRPMLFTCDLGSIWRWDARTGEPLPITS